MLFGQISLAVFFGRCRNIFRAMMAQLPPNKKIGPYAFTAEYNEL